MKKILVFVLAVSFIACNDNSSEKKEETKIEPVTNSLLSRKNKKMDGNYYLMAHLLRAGITMAEVQLVIYGKWKMAILNLPGQKKRYSRAGYSY